MTEERTEELPDDVEDGDAGAGDEETTEEETTEEEAPGG